MKILQGQHVETTTWQPCHLCLAVLVWESTWIEDRANTWAVTTPQKKTVTGELAGSREEPHVEMSGPAASVVEFTREMRGVDPSDHDNDVWVARPRWSDTSTVRRPRMAATGWRLPIRGCLAVGRELRPRGRRSHRQTARMLRMDRRWATASAARARAPPLPPAPGSEAGEAAVTRRRLARASLSYRQRPSHVKSGCPGYRPPHATSPPSLTGNSTRPQSRDAERPIVEQKEVGGHVAIDGWSSPRR